MIRCVREGRTCQHAHSARVCSPALLASAFAPRCEEEIEKSRSAGGSSERRRGAALLPFSPEHVTRCAFQRVGAACLRFDLLCRRPWDPPPLWDGGGVQPTAGMSRDGVVWPAAWRRGCRRSATARLSAWRPTPESTGPSPCGAAGHAAC